MQEFSIKKRVELAEVCIQLIESSDLTVFNVVKGVKTEVISILNIESAFKKKKIQGPHFTISLIKDTRRLDPYQL